MSATEYDLMQDIYRITAVLKVETDIITSIAASPIGRAVILVIMYVETFKTNDIMPSLVTSKKYFDQSYYYLNLLIFSPMPEINEVQYYI
jgi:hypothetical protein